MKKNCIQRVQAFLLALVLICSLAVPVAMAEGEISLNYTAAAMEIGDTLTLTADVAEFLGKATIRRLRRFKEAGPPARSQRKRLAPPPSLQVLLQMAGPPIRPPVPLR